MTEVTVTVGIIRDRIATAMANSGREPTDIRLVAVSKTHSPEAIRRVLTTGLNEFAENYLQEAVTKIQNLASENPCWHYIGRVQSNKTRDIAAHFDWVQTLDRARIATRLNEHRPHKLDPMNVCIQVRMSEDPNRPGADPATLAELAEHIEALPNLRLRGLMCMPPVESDPDAVSRHFDYTRRLYESLRERGHALDTLSMGTTADFERAIVAGANLVRIGTAIFGDR